MLALPDDASLIASTVNEDELAAIRYFFGSSLLKV